MIEEPLSSNKPAPGKAPVPEPGVRVPGAAQVAGATAALAVLTLLGKGTGLLRELVIAKSYGAGGELDAYLVALAVPDLLATVALYVSLTLFLPVYLSRRETHPEDADRLASVFWGRTTLVLLGLAAAVSLAAPLVVQALAPGVDPSFHRTAVYGLRLMALIILFRGMQGILRGLVNAHRHFILPTLGMVLVSLVVIGFVWGLSGQHGIRALVWGVVAGSTVPVLVVLPQAVRTVPGLFRWGFRSHPAMREITTILPWLVAVEVVSLALPLVDRALASRLLAEGRISALAYAQILWSVPIDLVGLTLATTLFPEFAAMVARRDTERFQRILRRGVRAAVAIILPVAALLVVLRNPLIRAIYERGAFDAEATRLTAAALWAYALGLPFVTAAAIATQAAYAARLWKRVLWVKGAAMAGKILVSLLLIPVLGHAGLALGTTAFFLLVALFLVPSLGGGWRGLVPKPGVLLAASLLAVGSGWGLTRLLAAAVPESGIASLGVQAVVWTVSGLVYLGACRVGRLEEVLWVEDSLLSRFRGRQRS